MQVAKKWFFTALAFVLVQVTTFAQDGEILDVDIDLDTNEWYENPIIWVGVALLLVVLVLLSRRSA